MWRTLPYLLAALWCNPATAGASPVEELHRFLAGLEAGTEPAIAGRPLQQPELIVRLYRQRHYQPVWTAGGPLASRTPELLSAIEQSTRHGLDGAAYHQHTLSEMVAAGDSARDLQLEILASDAFLHQVRHRTTGVVSPAELDPDWLVPSPEADAVATLIRVIDDNVGLQEQLKSLWPDSDEYQALVAHRARILALGTLEPPAVPAGPALRSGQAGDRVVALKERLLGPGNHTPLFDDDLSAAVTLLQRAAGIDADGIVGAATLQILNTSRMSWIKRIDANLERWRWLPQQQPDTHLRVNIAAFQLQAIRGGREVMEMDVIVGRPYQRTPVFTDAIRYMVFNPYWNLPYSIAVRDKLPVLRNDAAALEALGYEARPAGEDEYVPVTDIDWSRAKPGHFPWQMRQRPGPHNALGRVKFMFPNIHAVYLHDTPSRALFHKPERGFSSGCIRLSRPLELAAWMLENDGRSDEADRIDEIVASGTTTVMSLRQPLPVHLVYFTAFSDTSGTLVFRPDLYGRDAPLVAALHGEPSS